MATIRHIDREKTDEPTRIDFHKRIEAKEYEVKRARHDALEWQHIAEDEGMELIHLRKDLAEARRLWLYERIAWLLLSTSLVLAHLL